MVLKNIQSKKILETRILDQFVEQERGKRMVINGMKTYIITIDDQEHTYECQSRGFNLARRTHR